jgi:hypothetical protein
MPIFLLTPSTIAPVPFITDIIAPVVWLSTSVAVALPESADPMVSVIEIWSEGQRGANQSPLKSKREMTRTVRRRVQ